MRNILILAGVAGLAAAVAMYFVNEANKTEADHIADAADDALHTMDKTFNKIERRGFNAMG